jgi:hypothetical protein
MNTMDKRFHSTFLAIAIAEIATRGRRERQADMELAA